MHLIDAAYYSLTYIRHAKICSVSLHWKKIIQHKGYYVIKCCLSHVVS